MWNRKYVTGEAVGHLHGMRELRVSRDRIDQEKIGAGQLAGLVSLRRALQVREARQPHQRRKRLPVARCSAGVNQPEAQRTEG